MHFINGKTLVFVKNPDRPNSIIAGKLLEWDTETKDTLVEIGPGLSVVYALEETYLSLDTTDEEIEVVLNSGPWLATW